MEASSNLAKINSMIFSILTSDVLLSPASEERNHIISIFDVANYCMDANSSLKSVKSFPLCLTYTVVVFKRAIFCYIIFKNT